MILQDKQIEKADPLLQNALEQAEGDEVLRAIVLLGPDRESKAEGNVHQEIHPAQFHSHDDYRRALIDKRQNQLTQEIGSTIDQLRSLSLTPRGGKIGRTVVIEGPAREILKSLELPGVRHASLDRPIELLHPNRRG